MKCTLRVVRSEPCSRIVHSFAIFQKDDILDWIIKLPFIDLIF